MNQLDEHIRNGVINWGEPIQRILDDAVLFTNQVRTSERTPLATVLIEGPPKSGKTALAVQIAKNSEFPFLKMCSPENVVAFHETAKCQTIKKVLNHSSLCFAFCRKQRHGCVRGGQSK